MNKLMKLAALHKAQVKYIEIHDSATTRQAKINAIEGYLLTTEQIFKLYGEEVFAEEAAAWQEIPKRHVPAAFLLPHPAPWAN